MPRKDTYHEAVRVALEKDGWTITHDPLTVPTQGMDLYIDLGAERVVIGAERDGEQIEVEIKSLKRKSYFYDFYQAFGQFLIYRLGLEKRKILRILFLALPNTAFQQMQKVEIFRDACKTFSVHLLVFDEKTQTISQWIKN